MTGTDHRIHNRAVHGNSIAGSGNSADQDDDNAAADVVVADVVVAAAAAAEDGGMWYDQAVGDGEIGAMAARTEAPDESVALERQTSTQIPGADSPFGRGSVL